MQKKSKLLILTLSLALSIALTTGIVRADDSSNPETLRITYVKLPLNVPAIIIKDQKMLEYEFAKDGIRIDRPEITSGGKQTQAMAAGSIDIASVISSTSAIAARANGVDIKVVAIFARAPRAFNIVSTNPAIKSIVDLKGSKVAGPKGSLLNQTLFAALAHNGLQTEDVGFVHMSAPRALVALIGGSVDAALIAGPLVPKAESQGARIIATGEGLVKGLIVTAVKESFLNKYPRLVRRYLAVQKKAIEFMKNHPDRSFEIVAEETGIQVDDVKRMYPWYDFDPSIKSSDRADIEETQSFLIKSGMIERPVEIEDLVMDMLE